MIPPEGGVLPVDKPVGPTSHDMVARARRGLRTRRVGHTGTLDPFASGLLLLCVGPVTRISSWLTAQPKVYEARARLGVVTTTLDPEGEITATREGWQELTEEAIRAVLRGFEGPQAQIPPVFSAKKIDGEPAHRRVRRGEDVELPPVQVTIASLTLLSWEPPELTFRVACSSGTYIRALARDLGEALEVGAYLTGLRRTAVGDVGVDEAVDGDALDAVPEERWLRPAEALRRAGMAPLVVDDATARRLAMGQVVPHPDAADGMRAVVYEDGTLVAVGEVQTGRLRPRKVFVQP